ncbi:hypothetical protein DSO57_1018718 [Entomophthora muscae]|uniref:Uncharacterized protein n=1 Tax=Entomophthora muscae TaxID=34485 RepID=A0ACC2RJ38_9FUNG|nr:hypothetical protein DSO57_1018718 [Entomophthora muscae]
MSARGNNNPSLHQVYQDLMASIKPEDFKTCQLQAQDCDTTMASSECDTATQAEEEEGVDSIFAETEMPLVCLSCLGFEDLQDWSNNIVLKTDSSPLATPSVLL